MRSHIIIYSAQTSIQIDNQTTCNLSQFPTLSQIDATFFCHYVVLISFSSTTHNVKLYINIVGELGAKREHHATSECQGGINDSELDLRNFIHESRTFPCSLCVSASLSVVFLTRSILFDLTYLYVVPLYRRKRNVVSCPTRVKILHSRLIPRDYRSAVYSCAS